MFSSEFCVAHRVRFFVRVRKVSNQIPERRFEY
jgi:hypothetical protein